MNKVILSTIAASFTAICSAATTYDLANGNVTVPANTTATITQSNNGTATENTITINEGATVTLQGINIQSKWAVPISCVGSSTIIIADGSSNTVTSTSAYYAAIYAGNPGSTLTIKGGTAGTGILVADSTSQGSGAGIGASHSSPSECGNIVIEGGVIRAMSQDGAGIGGSSDAKSGDITIKGGNVLATSNRDNSGIGGGAGNITISGGTVVASGGRLCAGIGSGRSGGGDSSKVGNITISGGTVRATGGGGAAGIGTGKGHVCGAISITGGDVVATAVTDQYFSGQAGIGAGDAGKVNGNITIGNGIIKVVATVVSSSVSHINLGSGSTGTISVNSKLKQVKSNNNLTLTLTPTYTITWKNENGTTLETDARVDRGTTPIFNGATPTKASTAQYSYTFNGWSPTVVAATADKTYTATYTSTVRSYDITWKDDDGTTLRVDTLEYGTTPAYGDTVPTKASTAQYSYAFSGWDAEVVAVTGAATYTATYEATVRSYDITWLDEDGTTLRVDTLEYGTTPEYGDEVPTKASTAQYSYAFSGWDAEVAAVTGTATYTATYEATVRSYDITWLDEDGATLRVDTLEYGTTPAYGGEVPTRASTAQYSYAFSGWDAEVVAVTEAATYTATYEATVRSYDITWQNSDGTVLKIDTLDYGETPEYDGTTPKKAQDAQYAYTFAGWNAPIVAVTEAATYTATYSKTLRSYTVTWRDWDSSIIDYDVFFYGDTPEYQGEEPVRDGYEFIGWFTSTTGGEPLDETFAISGKTSFFARWKQIRFLEGDVACIDGSVTLTSSQIAWLNGLGDYETIKASVAAMDSKAFEDAYLLNLDVTDAGRGYSFDVTGCDATGENVVVSVRLVRTGAVRKSGVDAPINGVLMLCGATAPAKDGFAPLSEIVMDNAKFSNGDEATLTFSKDATTRFFKPVVAMP